MRVSDNNTSADNIIKLVECLKKIQINDLKIGFYTEKCMARMVKRLFTKKEFYVAR